MENNRTAPKDTITQQYLMAKLLLNRYGALHSFHEQQLIYYSIACCNISLGGKVEVDAEKKQVSFSIHTEKFYKKDAKEKVEKSFLDKMFFSRISNTRYNEEKIKAANNLRTWTADLLWGPATNVIINIDGVRQ